MLFIVLSLAYVSGVLSSSVEQSNLRSSLITKANYRQDKQLKVPEPFVVSSSLQVTESEGNSRRGKTFSDEKGKIVVEGVRMPDDETDRVTWRNGRVINNNFVPNAPRLPEYIVRSGILQSRTGRTFSNSPSIENFQKKAYTVSGKSEDLHSDRSPYNFEPADTASSNEYLAPASQNDFIIREQTYQSCPTCPSFSIPIPIPKGEALQYQQEEKKDTFLSQLSRRLLSSMNQLGNVFRSQGTENLSEGTNELLRRLGNGDNFLNPENGVGNKLPIVAAGVAALGGLAYLASSISSSESSRSYKESSWISSMIQNLNLLERSLNEGEPQCMAEDKCRLLLLQNSSSELEKSQRFFKERFGEKQFDLCFELSCSKEDSLTIKPIANSQDNISTTDFPTTTTTD